MLDSRPIIAAKNTDLAGKIFTRESGVTSITFINTGKTPAVNARLKITREFRAAPLPENAPTQQLDNPQQSNAIFAPGMETKVLMNTPLLNDEQLAAALENRTRYYIWGLAEYDDIFGNHYRTRFCVVSDVFHNEVHFVFRQNNNVFE